MPLFTLVTLNGLVYSSLLSNALRRRFKTIDKAHKDLETTLEEHMMTVLTGK